MTIAADRLSATLSAVGELARPFDMTAAREAQRRPCRLEAAPLREVSARVDACRQFRERRLDRREVYLRKSRSGKGRSHGRKGR